MKSALTIRRLAEVPAAYAGARRDVHSPWWKWIAGPAVILVVWIGIYLGVTRYMTTPERRVPAERLVISSAMSLSAFRANGAVTITWDAATPVISGARVGVLTITDGQATREFPLTKAQLQAQKFVYAATGDRLDVALEAFSSSGQATRESMIVAVGQTAVQAEPVAPAPVRTRQPEEEEELYSETRAFRPPPERTPVQAPVAAPVLSDAPPSLQIAARSAADAPVAPIAVPSLKPPALQQVLVQPPQLVRQANPALPPNFTLLVRSRVEVRVRVSVDASGRPTAAEALPGDYSGIAAYLARSAVQAAMQSRFTPARRGETPLPGEIVLRYSFQGR